jgi:glycerol-3-phosphate acyltransferase PlsY
MIVQLIGSLEIHLSSLIALTFCALYHLFAPWWRYERGRSIMTLMGVLAVVLTNTSLRLLTGPAFPPVRVTGWVILRLVIFTGVPIALSWQLRLLWITQIRPVRQRYILAAGASDPQPEPGSP